MATPCDNRTDLDPTKMILQVLNDGRLPATEQFESLDDDVLKEVLRAATAGIARLEAVQVAATAVLNRRRSDSTATERELMESLHISKKHAGDLVASASAFTSTMPNTFSLMQDGKLTLDRASKVAAAAKHLSADAARAVDAEVAPRLADKNPDQVRRTTYYAAQKARSDEPQPQDSSDQDDRNTRTTRRGKSRGLVLSTRNADTATLTLFDVPTDLATSAYSRITEAAQARKTADEVRSVEQLRAEVALELLLSFPADGEPERTSRNAPRGRRDRVSHPKSRRGRQRRPRHSNKTRASKRRQTVRRAEAAQRRYRRRRCE